MSMERNCTILLHYDKNTPPNEDEIREELEHKDIDKKISGLKTLISLTLNGEVMPKLLMTVIRFCVPSDNHQIKKLLLIYWEVIDKTGPDGKLLPEMILVWCAPRPRLPPCAPALVERRAAQPWPCRLRSAPLRTRGALRRGASGGGGQCRGSCSARAVCARELTCRRHRPRRSNNLRNDLSHANEYIRGTRASAEVAATPGKTAPETA